MSYLTVVMYHYIRDAARTRYPDIKSTTIDTFKSQLGYIKTQYRVITMEELFESAAKKKKLPQNAMLLTFDDGLIDHFENVFPILQNEGMQGSFFPPARAIEEHAVLNVHKIHFILAASADKTRLIKDIFALLDAYRSEYGLDTNEAYFKKLAVPKKRDTPEIMFIKHLLQKELPEKLRARLVDVLFSRFVSKDETAFAKELYMNAEQLEHIRKEGMYIGSHGWNHDWYTSLSPDAQEQDVACSLQFLETLGCDTSRFAMSYPHGAYNDSLISILKRRGCVVGFTTEVGTVTDGDDPFRYKRLDTNDLPPQTVTASAQCR